MLCKVQGQMASSGLPDFTVSAWQVMLSTSRLVPARFELPCTESLSGPCSCWRGGVQETGSTQLEELVCRRPGWRLEPLASPASPSTLAPAAPVHSPPGSAASSSSEMTQEPQASPPAQDADCSSARLQQALPAKLQTLLYFRLHPPPHPPPVQSQAGGVPHASIMRSDHLETAGLTAA